MRRSRVVVAVVVAAVLGFVTGLAAPRLTGGGGVRRRPAVFFRVPTHRRLVALTFDDGPDPRWTPTVLSLLDRYHAKATFFLVGANAVAHPDLVHAELAAGDEVGNHSYDHPDLILLTPAGVDSEVERATTALQQVGAPAPRYFRPPRGLTDEAVGVIADVHRYRTVLWDLAVEHFVDHVPTVAEGVRLMLDRVRPGSIILAHDGGIPDRRRTMEALPLLLGGLRARGYGLVDVTQLLAARSHHR